jgi:hypothetical protein
LVYTDPRVLVKETLPKAVVSEVDVDPDYLALVGGVEPVWERPASYIVYQGNRLLTGNLIPLEKTSEEQDDMVEYDMDSEDEMWVTRFNSDRRAESRQTISEDLFEKAIDRLEKESFLQVTSRWLLW